MLSSGPFRPAADISSLYAMGDEWLVPGIIPRGGLVILASSPKTGKTCLATTIARAVAKGEEFLGQPVRQSPVLWCAYEETPLERVCLHEGLTVEDPLLIAYPGELPPLPTRIGKTDRFGRRDLSDCEPPFIFEHAQSVGAKLIVIDCLHAAVEGVNLADNSSARAIMGILRTWSFYHNVSLLVLHHLTKSGTRGHQPERFADSAQILAAASCHFFMDRYEENPLPLREAEGEGAGGGGASLYRVVLHGMGRNPVPYARLDLLSEGPLDYRIADPTAPARPKKLNAQERVKAMLLEGWTLTAVEIGRRLEMNPTTVRYALARLQEVGEIHLVDKVRRAPRYGATPTGNAN